MSSDEELTALALAAGAGDRTALAEFIRTTQADVWRFVAHLTDVQSADDLTQETFLRAMGSLPRFAGRSTARTWLLSIARRAVIDRLRNASARPRTTGGADWETAIDQRRDRHDSDIGEDMVVSDFLRHLADDRREAFVLTQILGLSYAEAAQTAGCPVGTIRSRVARARETLVELWQSVDTDSTVVYAFPRAARRDQSPTPVARAR
ncbi:sigma-70 family RNA polymerase sigma factor [Nocardia flavorosea]|uniref:RNA polymerase sigma factor n=1 Tax=Nocardia flavorosea TaxID=53429 RepID=A0A846YH56_9NOCA|nr:sigma-70 family RNA polymerase sigma factor [Nocardia flavorosea]NKY57014.1 sigma-70 family RNA polymerase sigma factor [Nocardia flavorosea]